MSDKTTMADNPTTVGNVVFSPAVLPGQFSWTSSTPVVTWGSASCEQCRKPFDYIKEHRAPVPILCKRCDP